ncbi:MAG: SUMF1/EgtB/PvdO family nonheme iron enzyme [Candidatus Parcubacteria bacterium]|nr:SUMF1/EgtB/PvdO family nonheme iron enzyme [Candidatus Parcubacteria bacterium]
MIKRASIQKKKSLAAFTLIELLVVMGILGVLMAVTILVINPAQYMKRSRDTARVSDMESISKAINILMANNVSPFNGLSSANIYLSLPNDISPSNTICNTTFTSSYDNSTVYTFICNATQANLKNSDGTGWLPINLKSVGLPTLPTDPVNTYILNNTQRDDRFYAFITNGSSYEIDSKPEYMGYKTRDGFPLHNAAVTDLPTTDGGDNGLYEYGTQLTLMPDSGGLCPVGMVYVPYPADVCMDQYEEAYSSSGTKVDGTGFCSSNCPASKRSQNPWASRSGWPSVSQITAATYCANMGKVLPSDFEWWVAATGTPDASSDDGSHGPCMDWNTSSADGIVQIPSGSTQCTDGYVWGSDTNPNIKTGTASLCKSLAGAYDMNGNMWEWVADQKTDDTTYGGRAISTIAGLSQIDDYGIPVSSGGTSCTGGKCNSDYFWRNASPDNTLEGGLRGESWNSGSTAGSFHLGVSSAPSDASNAAVGFRCALR